MGSQSHTRRSLMCIIDMHEGRKKVAYHGGEGLGSVVICDAPFIRIWYHYIIVA